MSKLVCLDIAPELLRQSDIEKTSRNLFKLVKIGLNCLNLPWFVQTRRIVSKLVQTCLKLSKLFQTFLNFYKIVQTCPNLSKLVQTCPNLSKSVQTCLNLSKLVKTCPNWTKLESVLPDSFFSCDFHVIVCVFQGYPLDPLPITVQTCPNFSKLVLV